MKEHKVLIIVPAFNEEESIGKTLHKLIHTSRNSPYGIDICVVNDGSSDRTVDVVQSFPEVILLDLPYNLGIGGAMQTGYRYAYENNYQIAIQFDADGQHNNEDLSTIIEPLYANEADMIVGSRFVLPTDYKGSSLRRFGIVYFMYLLYLLTKQKFTDPTSGFRAINNRIIKEFAHKYPKDYPEPEVLIYIHKKGYVIQEKSVQMQQRQGGSSSITPFKSMYYMLKVTLSILMQKVIKE
ncbi:glycosyltransferase family 2 protein [Pseudalkalibacillus berkeleyi]|uniref:Glycosyltransferase family 2 protein n=1 Tax=Pseudalkalibacillus berkeleyi TaxID=1069813 RepID=A0ABS9H1B5_9BACL|nr:glycosyltransferase family 2 protein [Pseudalkalibacillus berkeleyi]MCF6138793.1 glycosyltransferase family 2 protein [Pseudalkalibacillus berkeleyi]